MSPEVLTVIERIKVSRGSVQANRRREGVEFEGVDVNAHEAGKTTEQRSGRMGGMEERSKDG